MSINFENFPLNDVERALSAWGMGRFGEGEKHEFHFADGSLIRYTYGPKGQRDETADRLSAVEERLRRGEVENTRLREKLMEANAARVRNLNKIEELQERIGRWALERQGAKLVEEGLRREIAQLGSQPVPVVRVVDMAARVIEAIQRGHDRMTFS
jgi:hypothetical protein